jgi:type VI secretion system protein VasI
VTVLRILVFVLAFAAAHPAMAQGPGGVACAPISDEVERLACYDAIFRHAEPGTDARSLVLESHQLIPADPSGRAPATMTFACESGELVLRLAFAGNLLSATGSETGITFTRDLSGDRVMTLPPSESGTELVMRPTTRVLSFLDWLRGATNVTVRVTPADYRSLTVRFRIAELRENVAPVISACE